MPAHPLTHVSPNDLADDSQRSFVELLQYVDLMADEAGHKADQAQDARRVAFYLGVVFGMEMTRGEILRMLERLIHP